MEVKKEVPEEENKPLLEVPAGNALESVEVQNPGAVPSKSSSELSVPARDLSESTSASGISRVRSLAPVILQSRKGAVSGPKLAHGKSSSTVARGGSDHLLVWSNVKSDGADNSNKDTPKKGLSHIAHLNGLRALAFFGVLVFHFRRGLQGGFLGVDVFFVLSGYLMTRSILFQLHRGQLSYPSFMKKRFWRLYPALLSTIMLTLALTYAFFPTEIALQVSKSAASSVFGASNFFYMKQEGYFGTSSALKPLLHTWSLSVEWQFYLVWPLFLLIAHRNLGSRGTSWSLVFIGLASFLHGATVASSHPQTAFFMLPGRVFEFAVGALATTCPPVFIPERLGNMLSVTGTGLIVASFVFLNSSFGAPALIALPAVFGATMVILSPSHIPANRIYRSPVLDYIGKISYSAYLVHWPVYVFYHHVYEHTAAPWVVEALVVVGLMVASAWMYHNIEDEFRLGQRFRHQVLGGMFVVATLALSFSGIQTAGWPDRDAFSTPVARAYPHGIYLKEFKDKYGPMERELPGSTKVLEYGFLPNDTKRSLMKKHPFDAIVVGDSFAAPLAGLFDSVARGCDKNYVLTSQYSCAPFFDRTSMNGSVRDYASPATNPRGFYCKDSLRPRMLELLTGTNTKYVVMIGNWLATSQMWKAGYESVRSFGSKAKALTTSQLEETIAIIRGHNKKILLIGMVPGAHYNARSCLASMGPLSHLKKCPMFSRFKAPLLGTAYQQRQMANRVRMRKTLNSLVAESAFLREGIANKWLAYVDPYKFLCHETRGDCVVAYNREPLYSDEYHLTGNGTLLLREAVMKGLDTLSMPEERWGNAKRYCTTRTS